MALTTESTLDLVSYAAALKQYYRNIDFTQVVFKKFPWLGMVPKDTEFVGTPLVQPLAFATVPSRSTNFQTAQALAGSSQQIAFKVTTVKDYSLAYIDRETMLASKSDEGSWLKAATHEIDMALKEASKSLGFAVIGDGSGVIGTISSTSTVGSTQITLADIRQSVNFQVNDTLQLVAPGTSVAGLWNSAVRSGTVVLNAVNRQTGVLTATGNWSAGISTASAGDGIVKDGDFNGRVAGLGAWLPLVAPGTSDNFFGVNRSSDTRLSGVYTDGRGMPLEESAVLASANVAQEGGSPDLYLMNYANWVNMINALGTKKFYMREGTVKAEGADIGYSSVQIEGPTGPIDLVADAMIPSNVAYMLQKDTWCLHSRGEWPQIFDIDGEAGELLRQATADAYEVRTGGYGNLVCEAPGWNGVVQLR